MRVAEPRSGNASQHYESSALPQVVSAQRRPRPSDPTLTIVLVPVEAAVLSETEIFHALDDPAGFRRKQMIAAPPRRSDSRSVAESRSILPTKRNAFVRSRSWTLRSVVVTIPTISWTDPEQGRSRWMISLTALSRGMSASSTRTSGSIQSATLSRFADTCACPIDFQLITRGQFARRSSQAVER